MSPKKKVDHLKIKVSVTYRDMLKDLVKKVSGKFDKSGKPTEN